MARRIVLLLVYGCYALLLTGILLVVLFPRDQVPGWLAHRVEQQLPGFACRIDDVRYLHPFAIRIDQIILDNSTAQIKVPIDALSIRFKPGWPLAVEAVSASLFKGSLNSDISIDWPGRRIEMRNLSISSIHLNDIDFLHRRLDRQIGGKLDLSGELVVNLDRYDTMRFTGAVEIGNFATKLRRPVLEQRDISFNRIGADLRQQGEIIEILGGRFDGDLIGGTFSGWTEIRKPWQDSLIEIESRLILKPALLENDERAAEIAAGLYSIYQEAPIPGRAIGTLKEPQFSFGREIESRVQRVQ